MPMVTFVALLVDHVKVIWTSPPEQLTELGLAWNEFTETCGGAVVVVVVVVGFVVGGAVVGLVVGGAVVVVVVDVVVDVDTSVTDESVSLLVAVSLLSSFLRSRTTIRAMASTAARMPSPMSSALFL